MSETEIGTATQATRPDGAQVREELFALLYAELRRTAKRELRAGPALTVSPTTLLHETFLNLSQRDSLAFADRDHFMFYAARVMRGLVIDFLRRRQAQKRGGNFEITSLPDELEHAPEDELQLTKLSEALESLATVNAHLAECVDLRYFCGFSFEEIAELRKVSERTVRRDWNKARLMLNMFMGEHEDSGESAP